MNTPTLGSNSPRTTVDVVRLTRFTSDRRLTKRFVLQRGGVDKLSGGGKMSSGKAVVMELPFSQLPDLIAQLTDNEALTYGTIKNVHPGQVQQVTIKDIAEKHIVRAMIESGVWEITADLRKVAHCCQKRVSRSDPQRRGAP